MNSDERKAARRMIDTWTELDDWRGRLTATAPPSAESALAADDSDFPGWPISRLAHGGLAAAVDHLQAIRVHLEAKNMFPFATGTLLRGAFLGSAQAVWLLSPSDQPARLERSRKLAEEMTHKHLQFLTDLRSIASPPHANTDLVHRHVTKRFAEIRALRAEYGQKGTFNATEVIESAAATTFGSSMSDEARTEWRRLSGSAHGLVWSTIGSSSNTVTPTNDPETVEIMTGGTPTNYLNSFLLAHRVTGKGWELFERLSRV